MEVQLRAPVISCSNSRPALSLSSLKSNGLLSDIRCYRVSITSGCRRIQRGVSSQVFRSSLSSVRCHENKILVRSSRSSHMRRGLFSRMIIRSEADFNGEQASEKDAKKSRSISSLELENKRPSKTKNTYNGVFVLLLANIGIYALDHWLHLPVISQLYLHHDYPKWYQFITATFCHVNWTHLSSNLFFLYIFGKLIEEDEGGFAVWFSYLMTGVGANLVSWWLLPRTVISAGASGAVFGLFAVSVLIKMSFDWRKIIEVLILGQFVVEKVMEEAQASASLGNSALQGSMNINHIAHLSGALLGVVLIYLLNRLPSGDAGKK